MNNSSMESQGTGSGGGAGAPPSAIRTFMSSRFIGAAAGGAPPWAARFVEAVETLGSKGVGIASTATATSNKQIFLIECMVSSMVGRMGGDPTENRAPPMVKPREGVKEVKGDKAIALDADQPCRISSQQSREERSNVSITYIAKVI
jgi:hypothetical protein